MKKNARIAITCSVSIICLLAIVMGIIFGVKKSRRQKEIEYNRVAVGFFEISQAQRAAFSQLVEKTKGEKTFAIEFYEIDKEQDFVKQIAEHKINLILAPAGFAVQKAVDAAADDAEISADTTGGMFSSMRQLVISKNEKLKAIPLIFDNLEIDIEFSAFKMSGLERIATWDDIEQFEQLQKANGIFPLSFAGAEPDFLIDLLGALGEALDGYDAYVKAADILKAAVQAKKDGEPFDAAVIAKKIFIDPDAPLPYSAYYLKQLVKKGYVGTASKELVHTDINSYIQQRVTKSFFTTLSVHRTYDTKAVSRFSTIYVPSENAANQRHFTATATFAVPLNNNENVEYVIEQLIQAENQATLSQLTGLAPVLANCRTPDQQADDARYWVAATNAPLAGLSREAELSTAELKALADEVRAMVFY